jgi:alanine racemase
VAPALWKAGCRDFFVAHLGEGIGLRRVLGGDARIFVLNGTPPGTEAEFIESALIPVVNSPCGLAAWRRWRHESAGADLPVALQLDTGMTRLGLSPADAARIAADPSLLAGLRVELVMSHLACADEPDHEANRMQLAAFRRLRAMLPPAPASLANSSGIHLGPDWHFDLARPGAALYGINPVPGQPNPMRPVITLAARILQIREIAEECGVGYGHSARCDAGRRLATLSYGYADGWPRNAAACAFHGDTRLPFIGRVSMDSIVVDVSECGEPLREGGMVELIGERQTVDDVAAAAGTIGYEILTRLGHRAHRRYAGG